MELRKGETVMEGKKNNSIGWDLQQGLTSGVPDPDAGKILKARITDIRPKDDYFTLISIGIDLVDL